MRSTGTNVNAGSRVRLLSGFSGAAALLTATVVVTASLLASCRSRTAETFGLKVEIETRKLSNGLTVILAEDHTIPVVSYQTWYRVGSVDERPGLTGISHLFEHLMFKGTEKYGPKEFFQQLEAKGAEVNAFTTRDYTVYYENFIPSLTDKVIEMEADRMAHLKLTEELLQSERMVVFEERRLRTDNSSEGRMQEALWNLAYRAHPYRWPVIGYPEDLAAITLEHVRSYFRTHYQPANATVVVVGDFDPGKVFARIKKEYGEIPALPRPRREIPAEPEQGEERRLLLHDEVASERFSQAYHVTSADEDDSYALDVLANILFAGTTSRAYRRIVDEKDLAVEIGGSAFTPTYRGLFFISGIMKNGVTAAEAEKLLDEVIREVQEKGVSDEEVQVAVKQLTVQLVDGVRTPHGLGIMIGTVQTTFGTLDRFADDLAKYLKVSAADVRRVAQKYLIPNNRSVVVLSPKRTASSGVAR